jgi:hypothetical protein
MRLWTTRIGRKRRDAREDELILHVRLETWGLANSRPSFFAQRYGAHRKLPINLAALFGPLMRPRGAARSQAARRSYGANSCKRQHPLPRHFEGATSDSSSLS